MEDKTYLEFLMPVALKAYEVGMAPKSVDAAGRSMALHWEVIETLAKNAGYDVFQEHFKDIDSTFRDRVFELTAALYGVPGATAKTDVDELLRKDREYGGSWKLRGGVGAFMMAARKMDRIVNQLSRCDYSLATALDVDKRPEGILDDLGDLRRYLLLWEAYYASCEVVR